MVDRKENYKFDLGVKGLSSYPWGMGQGVTDSYRLTAKYSFHRRGVI